MALPLVERISAKSTGDMETSTWFWENRWHYLLKVWVEATVGMLFCKNYLFFFFQLLTIITDGCYLTLRSGLTASHTNLYLFFHTTLSYGNDEDDNRMEEGELAARAKEMAVVPRALDWGRTRPPRWALKGCDNWEGGPWSSDLRPGFRWICCEPR